MIEFTNRQPNMKSVASMSVSVLSALNIAKLISYGIRLGPIGSIRSGVYGMTLN